MKIQPQQLLQSRALLVLTGTCTAKRKGQGREAGSTLASTLHWTGSSVIRMKSPSDQKSVLLKRDILSLPLCINPFL